MKSTMKKTHPDRYTVVKVSPGELASMIIHARTLGMLWFVKGDSDREGRLSLYLFFDEMGMNAYLDGEYEPDPTP